MTQPTLSRESDETLEAPANRTVTSDYEITAEAREAYAAAMLIALEEADDMLIALEVRRRSQIAQPTELVDFMREQGYDPAEFGA